MEYGVCYYCSVVIDLDDRTDTSVPGEAGVCSIMGSAPMPAGMVDPANATDTTHFVLNSKNRTNWLIANNTPTCIPDEFELDPEQMYASCDGLAVLTIVSPGVFNVFDVAKNVCRECDAGFDANLFEAYPMNRGRFYLLPNCVAAGRSNIPFAIWVIDAFTGHTNELITPRQRIDSTIFDQETDCLIMIHSTPSGVMIREGPLVREEPVPRFICAVSTTTGEIKWELSEMNIYGLEEVGCCMFATMSYEAHWAIHLRSSNTGHVIRTIESCSCIIKHIALPYADRLLFIPTDMCNTQNDILFADIFPKWSIETFHEQPLAVRRATRWFVCVCVSLHIPSDQMFDILHYQGKHEELVRG